MTKEQIEQVRGSIKLAIIDNLNLYRDSVGCERIPAKGFSTIANEAANEIMKIVESPSTPSGEAEGISDADEKEVMMAAFDKVRNLFERRSWIMEGRGRYPYNDDRYKEEVKYLYDEFDELQKDTWKNIKSKTFEYRNKIIEQYVAKSIPPVQEEKWDSAKNIEFQLRVNDWMLHCFGEKISSDIKERNHRFIEEALELVQATGTTASECHQLVDYVFGRNIGEVNQEVGGVILTLAALCNAIGLNINKAGETELSRVWDNVEKIRAKQAAKPAHSPLPESCINVQEGEPVDAVELLNWVNENYFQHDNSHHWYHYTNSLKSNEELSLDDCVTSKELINLFKQRK